MIKNYLDIVKIVEEEIKKSEETKNKGALASLVRIDTTIKSVILKEMLKKHRNIIFRDELKVKKHSFDFTEMYLVTDANGNVVPCITGQMAAFSKLPLAIKAYKEFPKQVKQSLKKWNSEFGIKAKSSSATEINIRGYIEYILTNEIETNLTYNELQEKVDKYVKGDNRLINVIMFGAPGVGKGTIAKPLSNELGVPAISTGDIFREHVEKGKGKVYEVINKGHLVSDELVIEVIESRIQEEDCSNGFILDGFPRTFAQADAYNRICEKHNLGKPLIINMYADEELIIKRLNSRTMCRDCGTTYSVSNPPAMEGYCDECSTQLIKRTDDDMEKIKERLEIYKSKTKPLIAIYESNPDIAELYNLDGTLNIDESLKQIQEALGIKTKNK